ncbi:hypothetical protein E3P99_03417 [Wallemia hederae]|uniref:lytic cellulose monooxygenase (C4-dehydrogenating) n=1 Tax=Wallemia hederae TaxID=1540922 RepID=A0A4T0FFG3_9BASI|nr:hypothetical protein E3P99_03417 [Wallemia hederae]
MLSSFVALSLAGSALAHGVVSYIDVGQGFNGPDPNQSDASSPVWTAGINPITDAYSPDMFCGPSSSPNGAGSIGAGSQMTIYWEETSYQQWPHNTGPIITYLAACNGDCSNMNSGSANWFKIDQQAMNNGQWVQAGLMNGGGYQVTVPSDLAAGNYLMRTEIIALHNSYPEFYPRCISWTITGGGSNTYSADATASFPGTYSPSDPGLADTGSSIYNVQSTSDYQFPGPDVVTVGQGGSSTGQAAAQPSANVNVQVNTQEADTESGDDSNDSGDSDNSESSESSAPASSSSSQEAAQPTQQAAAQENTQENTQEASSSSSSSSSPAPSSTASSDSADSSCTSQASEDDCETKWTQCNQNYTPGETYTCQDDFASCRGQSVQRRLASNAKMTRRRVRRDAHNAHNKRHH